ncbi:peptidase A2 domain-containing protein [Trichonephila clavipes]|nr:peptidase A2 domain-containing protein [Trichonephila clavipes]
MWTFLIADVSSPILGADFLHHFELEPDLRNTIYHKLLKELHSITKLPNPNQPVKHNDVHYIMVAKPRKGESEPNRLKFNIDFLHGSLNFHSLYSAGTRLHFPFHGNFLVKRLENALEWTEELHNHRKGPSRRKERVVD